MRAPWAKPDKESAFRTPSCCETTVTAASPQCFLGPRPRASVWWLLFRSFLQGLTSLNFGFCVGIKSDNMGEHSLLVQCYASVRDWYMRVLHPLSQECTELPWRQTLLPVWSIVCVCWGMSAWGCRAPIKVVGCFLYPRCALYFLILFSQ